MISSSEVLDIFTRTGVVAHGHFVLNGDAHSGTYLNKHALFPHTTEVSRLCRAVAEEFVDKGVEAVIAPATGGIVISQWVAYHLTKLTGDRVLALYAEKSDEWPRGTLVPRYGYDRLICGRSVLAVDDIATTYATLNALAETIARCYGFLAGFGVLCNRGKTPERKSPNDRGVVSLLDYEIEMWDETDCPLCVAGVPINEELGHGREYLTRKKGEGL